MSYCFRVRGVGAPPYSDVVDASVVQCESGQPLRGDWVRGHEHFLFIPGVTTRSVEAQLVDDELTVRLFSGACREDYQLALQVAEAFARRYHSLVDSEEGVRFLPSDRGHRYGRGWVDDHIRGLCKVMLRMAAAKRHDDPLIVHGPVRSFHLGPRTARAIVEAGRSDLERAEVMFAMMRQVQYPPLPVAVAVPLTLPDSERVVAAVVIEPQTAVMIERVDVVSLAADAPAHVPWEAASTLLGPFARMLDEWTLAIAPIPASDYTQLLAAACGLEMAHGHDNGELTQHTLWSTQVTDAPTEDFQIPVPRHDNLPVETGVRRWWDIWRQRR